MGINLNNVGGINTGNLKAWQILMFLIALSIGIIIGLFVSNISEDGSAIHNTKTSTYDILNQEINNCIAELNYCQIQATSHN
jgi:hypothetical protein